MDFKVNKKNLFLFHIFSPVALVLIVVFYFALSQHDSTFFIFAGAILLIDFFLNMVTLFITYNEITLEKDRFVLRKGLLKKKAFSMFYKDIKEFERAGIQLPGWKPFDAIVPLQGITYRPSRDKIKIFKSYISDENFDILGEELMKRAMINGKRN